MTAPAVPAPPASADVGEAVELRGAPKPWWAIAALVTALAAYGGWLAWFVADHSGALYDDAYIYFRYADNLLQGCGLRFNCADAPVEGFTSPLYLLLLTLAGGLGAALPTSALWLGTVSTWAAVAVAMVLAYRVAKPAGPWPARLAAVATAVALTDHFWLLNAVTGLETPLAAVAVAAVGLALHQQRFVKTAIFLAWLIRPEAAAFGIALLVSRRYLSVRWLLPLAVAVGAVVLMRLGIFGDWLPNTARAKAGGSMAHLRLGVAYLLETVQLFPLVMLAPLAGLAATPWRDPPPELQQERQALTVWLTGAALWLLLLVWAGGDHFAYGRLLAPLVPAATALGSAALARGLLRLGGPSRWLRADLGPLTAATLVAAWGFAEHRLQPNHGFDNVQRWSKLGDYLKRTFPGATVATVPIGAIAYHSGLRVIDLVGLTQPAIARGGATVPPAKLVRNWIGHEREHTAWVLAQKPEVIALTRFAAAPWMSLQQARAGFWAEWQLLRAVKQGRAPYVVHSAEIEPGVYGLLLVLRPPEVAAPEVAAPEE